MGAKKSQDVPFICKPETGHPSGVFLEDLEAKQESPAHKSQPGIRKRKAQMPSSSNEDRKSELLPLSFVLFGSSWKMATHIEYSKLLDRVSGLERSPLIPSSLQGSPRGLLFAKLSSRLWES